MTKKKTESKVVANVAEGGLALSDQVPDFMKQYAGQGVETIDSKDVEVPRLILLQSLSDQVTDGDERAGDFYHTVLETSIGNSVRIVPIYTDIRYMLWRPRHEGGGILARADDGKHWVPANSKFTIKPNKGDDRQVIWETKPTVQESGLDQWGSYDPQNENSQPAATKMYNIVAYLPDYPEMSPCVITLQRGAVTVARKFMGKLKMAGLPSYGQVFQMSSFKDDTGSGDFQNFSFEKVGNVTDEALFNKLRDTYLTFKKEGLNIHDIESVGDEPASSGAMETAIDI